VSWARSICQSATLAYEARILFNKRSDEFQVDVPRVLRALAGNPSLTRFLEGLYGFEAKTRQREVSPTIQAQP
jgi:hypothetical protein